MFLYQLTALIMVDLEKKLIVFYHPMSFADSDYNFDREMEFGIQIGNHRFPEYPIRSVAEFSTQLRKLLSKYGTQYTDAMDITASQYRNNKFVIGIDTEKMPASFTGYNSKAGDLLTMSFKKQGAHADIIGSTKVH